MPLIILKQDQDDEKRDYILLPPSSHVGTTAYSVVQESWEELPRCEECDRSLLWGTKCYLHDER